MNNPGRCVIMFVSIMVESVTAVIGLHNTCTRIPDSRNDWDPEAFTFFYIIKVLTFVFTALSTLSPFQSVSQSHTLSLSLSCTHTHTHTHTLRCKFSSWHIPHGMDTTHTLAHSHTCASSQPLFNIPKIWEKKERKTHTHKPCSILSGFLTKPVR